MKNWELIFEIKVQVSADVSLLVKHEIRVSAHDVTRDSVNGAVADGVHIYVDKGDLVSFAPIENEGY